MEQNALEVYSRNSGPHSIIHHLREDGLIPGVLYGHNQGTQLIQLNEKEFNQQLKFFGKSSVFYVTINQEKIPVKINEVQRDNIDKKIIHVDLQRVEMNKPVDMEVPIQFFGKSIGEQNGGLIQQQLRSVELRGLPASIPNSIQLNISELDIGDAILVRDIYVPEGLQINHEPDSVVMKIIAPKLVEEALTEEPKDEPKIVNAKDGRGIDAAK